MLYFLLTLTAFYGPDVTHEKHGFNQRKYRSVFHSCLLMLTAPFSIIELLLQKRLLTRCCGAFFAWCSFYPHKLIT